MDQSFCQSCGMPLFSIENHGTNLDGSKVEDYCQYCFREGQFTSHCTMEEMIQLCSKYTKEWNKYTDRTYTKKEAVKEMRRQFPLLKRWARKEETQMEYYKSIGKVLDYVNEHLNEHPDLETLAGIAHLSTYHFHRIFKAVIGETLGEYRLRLCMEYVASQLSTTSLTLEELAQKTGYNGAQALSKTFKKHYGVAPSIFKKNPCIPVVDPLELSPEIRIIEPIHVITRPVVSTTNSTEPYRKAWSELENYASEKAIGSTESLAIGLNLDDTDSDNPFKLKFYACLSTQKPAEPNELFGSKVLEGGMYAVFTLKDSYEKLSDLYKLIYFKWLPTSGLKLRKGLSFEKYLNNPLEVKKEEVLTELFLPIATN